MGIFVFMKVRSTHTQETKKKKKKMGIGPEHVEKNLARSFSAWICLSVCVLQERGRCPADIFSRVTSSLRIELLCSYFDGNLNTIFLMLIKAVIIHNWKMFS